MRIREGCDIDAAGIANVHVASWRTTYRDLLPDTYLANLSVVEREALWRNEFARTDATRYIYVAEDDSQVVGFTAGGPARDEIAGYFGELYTIYILQQYQSQGVGRRLFEAVGRRLLSEGIQSMYVWVLARNRSRGFYEALGGRKVAQKEVDIGGTLLTEIAYGWDDLSSQFDFE